MKAHHLAQGVFFCSFLGVVLTPPSIAQNVTLDGTLGPSLEIAGPTYEIQQAFGTTVGENLFHSFKTFNLSAGEVASFASDPAIQNILSRVTGGNRSLIDGTLLTTSDAVNLFLINPNGILFGPNASLAIGSATRGSFIGTTLDGLVWPDGSRFDAVTPVDSQGLLNIVGEPSGFITNQQVAEEIRLETSNLEIAAGQQLLLLSGGINANSTTLSIQKPQGGRIELASVQGPGTVFLQREENDLFLRLPEILKRADISLESSFVDVTASDGGSISIYGNNINLEKDSKLVAGIAIEHELKNAQAGQIKIDAKGTFTARSGNSEDATRIENLIFPNSTGNAGDINITAREVEVFDRVAISTETLGQGNAGNIKIMATDRIFAQFTDFFSRVRTQAQGNAGSISIKAPIVEMVAASLVDTSTLGKGNAADASIIASERVTFQFSDIFSNVDVEAEGQGGNIFIQSPIVEMLDDSLLDSSTLGQGDAGNINILASKRSVFQNSVAISDVDIDAQGEGGDIVINTPILEIIDGGFLAASTGGNGNSGDIKITTDQRVIVTGAKDPLDPSTNSAILTFNVRPALENGELVLGAGRGGEIQITSPYLEVSDKAVIRADTFNNEPGGNINLDLKTLKIRDGGRISTASNGTEFSGEAGGHLEK